mmetsp:Transcript_11531/g.31233  ORF Transcript_11531/g.31233 Transcript_11531/m.31233 type:complete len:85 (+) Transcript_11531:690-944(+)
MGTEAATEAPVMGTEADVPCTITGCATCTDAGCDGTSMGAVADPPWTMMGAATCTTLADILSRKGRAEREAKGGGEPSAAGGEP